MIRKIAPSDPNRDDLTQVPPRGQHKQEPLVGSGHKLQEDGAVDDQVTAAACGCKSNQRGHANVRVGTSSCYQEDTTDEEGAVEGKATADNVAPESPEKSANDQANDSGQRLACRNQRGEEA